MSRIEALGDRIFTRAAIDFSQSVDLFSSINSAVRLIGRHMKGPEIRAAHDKIAFVATSVAQAVPILNEMTEMTELDRKIPAEIFLIDFFCRQGDTDNADWFKKKHDENRMKYNGLNKQLENFYKRLENLRRAAGLTLNDYDFSRANLFPGGWGLVILGLGNDAEKWNKFALLVACDEKGQEIVQEAAVTQKKRPSTNAIEISLAQLSSSHFDAPTIVQAKMVPLVTVDAQGVRLNQLQAPNICKIYNVQHVATTIKPPFLSPRLVYPRK